MKFGIKRKHSLANKYSIENWISLKNKKMIGFILENKNELYFDAQELSESYFLNEDFPQLRNEVICSLFEDLNIKLNLNELKISGLLAPEIEIKGGYKLCDSYLEVYTNNLEPIICGIFFDEFELSSKSEGNINDICLDLTLNLGNLNIPEREPLVKDTTYVIKSEFKVISCKKNVFNFVLGVDEIMLVKEDEFMNIEDNIGVSISPDIEELSIDLDVILGTIQMPISEIKELLVGDFINIESLSFTTIEIKHKNRLLAIGELVYNENDKLAIEISEVYL